MPHQSSKLLGIVAIMAVLSGCVSTTGSSGSTGGTVGPAGKTYSLADIKTCSKPTESLKIGAVMELSGPTVSFGKPGSEGVQQAVIDANSAGGVDIAGKCYKVDLLLKDNRTDPATAVAQVQGLIRDDGVKYIMGALSGLTSIPMAQITQSYNPPLLQLSGNSNFHDNGLLGKPGYDGLIRTARNNQAAGEAFATAIKAFLPNVKKVAVLFRNDTTSAGFIQKGVIEASQNVGWTVVATELYQPGTVDFSSVLTRIKASQPDLLWTGYIPAEQIAITRQATELKVAPAIAAWAGPTSIPLKSATGSPIGVPYVSLLQVPDLQDPQTPALTSFSKKLRSNFNETDLSGSFPSLYFYDPTLILIKAIQLAGNPNDLVAIRKNILAMKWNGALGAVCFDAGREEVYAVEAALVQGGQVTAKMIPPASGQCAT